MLILLLPILDGVAQVDFQDVKEFNTLLTFENIAVDWKGDGKTQLLLNEGINSLNENKLEAAIASFSDILSVNPDFWIALYFRGVCFKRQYNVIKAKADFQKLIELRADLPQSYLEMSKVKVLAGYNSDAIQFLTTCIEKFPKYVSAYYLMGDAYLVTKDVEKAKLYYQECEKISPNFSPAKVKLGLIEMATTKDPKAGLKFFNEVIETDSLQKEALWCRAAMYFKENPRRSLVDINTLVRHSQANLNFLLQRGYVLVELRDFEGAWRDFYKLISQTQINSGFFRGRAAVADKMIGIQNVGFYIARQIYGLSEENQLAIKKSYCLMFAGKDQEALDAIKLADKLHNTAFWQYLSGLIYEHLRQDEDAKKHYSKAIKLDREIFDAYWKRGIYRSRVADWTGAEKDFTEMIRISPGNKSGYKLRSIARYFLKDYKHCIDDANKGLLIDSTDCEIRRTLGQAQFATNNFLLGVNELYHCRELVFNNLDMVKLHQEIKKLLDKGDSVKAMRYLTMMTNAKPLYEAGTRLKIEILFAQKKWSELHEFLINRVHVFANLNSGEYKVYINEQLSQVEKILGPGKEKSD